ncbi:MAG: 2Fe-2S iron-sulfur cluster binding domain-containing protein, partial [Anaerolineae bacterium]|nr:2Fe-2S iron-sulfur cluster binding domain-containing protein [Anaerolineae bacterium]
MPKVTFLPQGKTAEVAPRTTLADAAEQVGLHIPQPCGGQGRCGRCKVVVKGGAVRRRSIQRLSSAELAEGYALACQTLVEADDVEVYIPSQEEVLARRPASEKRVAREITLPVECDWQSNPPIRRFYLEIEPPSLADNTSDFDRLQRTLNQQHGIAALRADLPVMRRLATTLREADWKVTAVLEMDTWDKPDGPPRLLDLLPGNHADGPLYGAAIDIGTTSNVIYLVDMTTARVVDTAAEYNGQIVCGEDIISRIIYAKRPGGLEHLQKLVLDTLNGLLDQLAERNGIRTEDIQRVAVAGNTTMIHLFLALP